MVENDENNVLIYESNEKGERVLVKSVESTQSVYIRFINRTSRPVDVWWRDFQGNRRHYARLESRAFYNIDTYVTHPWEFTDPATKENYRINNKKIFRPPRSLAGNDWNFLKSTANYYEIYIYSFLRRFCFYYVHRQYILSLRI